MSDTPRSDAELGREVSRHGFKIVSADFARQLERELNEANKKLSERLVNYCVCTGAQSPVPACSCVSCTTKRIEADRNQWKALAEKLEKL